MECGRRRACRAAAAALAAGTTDGTTLATEARSVAASRGSGVGVFSGRTSMDRILFAVFNHENRNQGVSTPLLLTKTF